MGVNLDERFDPNKTSASVNIVTCGFRHTYCEEFLKQYLSKRNYIASGNAIKNFITRLMYKLKENPEQTKDFIDDLDKSPHPKMKLFLTALVSLIQIIPRYVVGPKILDPIIIEVKDETIPYIHKVVENYITSPLRPIIILLLDEKWSRTELINVLKKFPINLKVAIHGDSGKTEVVCVIKNSGAESFDEFIDAYSNQCFNTCGYTDQEIILNDDSHSSLSRLSGLMVKSHSALLIDNKTQALKDISSIEAMLKNEALPKEIRMYFQCINALQHVYASDRGGISIRRAMEISKHLDNSLLTAFVNRFAYFIPKISSEERICLLESAADVFRENNIHDHRLYCMNNALTYSFYKDAMEIRKFNELIADALATAPGLAGMSILYANAGSAELYNRSPENALHKFQVGLDYAVELNRPAQRIGLMGNQVIAETLTGQKHQFDFFKRQLSDMIHMPNTQNLPFIQINGLLNLMAAALYQKNCDAALYIRNNPDFISILKKALQPNTMGSGSLLAQLEVLEEKSKGKVDFEEFDRPKKVTYLSGLRAQYIREDGFNPAIFNAWL